ncbi:MAG: NAD(+)/NADH kinase [Verrucomicrobiota bacterium]|nr:NAD(+)/NADH kinase [Verrucomicrobiota bacterium]
MKADKIKRVGLIGNPEKAEGKAVLRRVVRLIERAGRRAVCDADAAALARRTDLLLVFGGDGTLLRVAREIAGAATPLLGVNIGSLGFLTAVPSSDLPRALRQVWNGEFKYEDRALLQVAGRAEGRAFDKTALNDVVVSRGAVSRLIGLDVSVDGESVTHYRCDGLIVSSPTGSTAYSLAAGGPAIYPTAEVVVVTPICPHALSNRPLVLPLDAVIRIQPAHPKLATTFLSVDGQSIAELGAGDAVTIRRSRRVVRLVHLAGDSFWITLRHKLHWRGASV